MITIRRATNDDIPIIEDVLMEVTLWLEDSGKAQWKHEWITWEALSKNYSPEDFYLAYLDDEPVGCISITDYDPEVWPEIKKGEALFLHKLAVKRAGSGQGVSAAIFDYARTLAKERGIKSLRLDVHQPRTKLRQLYESLGFTFVRNEFLFGDYDAALYASNII